MKKMLMLLIFLIILPIALADLKISGNSRIDNVTKTYQNFQLLDFNDNALNSFFGFAGYKPIQVDFIRNCENISQWNISNPDNQVVYVNWSIQHLKNIYSSTGDIINQTTENTAFGCPSSNCNGLNTPFGISEIRETYYLAHRDLLYIEMFVQYADNVNMVFDAPCSFQTKVQSFSCKGCDDLTFEELTNQTAIMGYNSDINFNATNTATSLVKYNFQVWLILYYMIKIIVVIGIFILIISLVYFLYDKIREVA